MIGVASRRPTRRPRRFFDTGCEKQLRSGGRATGKRRRIKTKPPRETKGCQCLDGACLCLYARAKRFVQEDKLLATYDADSEQHRQRYGVPMSPFQERHFFALGEDRPELRVQPYDRQYWHSIRREDPLCWVLE